jgi:hypothetical protein
MIISASRRTDIPAYYSDWFLDRIKKGCVDVPNPFNPKQVSHVSLMAEDVTAIAFWTRDPAPMLDKLDFLDKMGYKYYFMVTLNNYPKIIEPNRIELSDSLEAFYSLVNRIGKGRVCWRYDPIILTDSIDIDFHKKNFELLFNRLSFQTNKIITSVVTPYRKTISKFKKHGLFLNDDNEQYKIVFDYMKEISDSKGLNFSICCPPDWFVNNDFAKAKCIDDDLLRNELGIHIEYKKDRSQRKNCCCNISKDIGLNNTCRTGCLYCYATKK